MTEVTCPGLPGAWINAWLAAVGATVLDARVRLQEVAIPQRFRWPAWGQPLDSNGIDALLDAWNPDS